MAQSTCLNKPLSQVSTISARVLVLYEYLVRVLHHLVARGG